LHQPGGFGEQLDKDSDVIHAVVVDRLNLKGTKTVRHERHHAARENEMNQQSLVKTFGVARKLFELGNVKLEKAKKSCDCSRQKSSIDQGILA
jgi:hypothetical protein